VVAGSDENARRGIDGEGSLGISRLLIRERYFIERW